MFEQTQSKGFTSNLVVSVLSGNNLELGASKRHHLKFWASTGDIFHSYESNVTRSPLHTLADSSPRAAEDPERKRLPSTWSCGWFFLLHLSQPLLLGYLLAPSGTLGLCELFKPGYGSPWGLNLCLIPSDCSGTSPRDVHTVA